MVAGRGLMACDVGVVQRPAVFMASDLTWLSFAFMVTMGAGRGGSLLNLLLGLNWNEGVCICCRLSHHRVSSFV